MRNVWIALAATAALGACGGSPSTPTPAPAPAPAAAPTPAAPAPTPAAPAPAAAAAPASGAAAPAPAAGTAAPAAAAAPAPAAAAAGTAAQTAPDAAAFAKLSPAEQKKKLVEIGENVYKTGGSGGVACITCHMVNGKGVPGAFPPLAGSDFMGDCKHHAGLVVKGKTGEITVLGQKFNGVMPAQPNLSDLEIAGAISYERESWGNNFGVCMPSDVAANR